MVTTLTHKVPSIMTVYYNKESNLWQFFKMKSPDLPVTLELLFFYIVIIKCPFSPPGACDPGSGTPPPDEPVPGQAHDGP